MKTLNFTLASTANLSNQLMWLKRSGYQQKAVQMPTTVVHDNLNWLRIKEYTLNSKNTSVQLAVDELSNHNIYYNVKFYESKRDFYFTAMSSIVLSVSLVLLTLLS